MEFEGTFFRCRPWLYLFVVVSVAALNTVTVGGLRLARQDVGKTLVDPTTSSFSLSSDTEDTPRYVVLSASVEEEVSSP